MSVHEESTPRSKNKLRSIWSVIQSQRNVLAFWIFGMVTNFVFIIALSAAHDILDTESGQNDKNISDSSNSTVPGRLVCNPSGTGVVLLGSIIPELILKIIVQFSPRDISYCIKVTLTFFSGVASFLLFAFGHEVWIRMIGVVCAGIAFGLGETTFVPLTSFYPQNTVTAWSSGTGAAGLIGTLSYAGFTSLGVSTCAFMLAMLSIPIVMVVTYVLILKPDVAEEDVELEKETLLKKDESLTFGEKIRLIPSMLKYVISLSMAYFTVYFINQGLLELLYFDGQVLSRSEQYRWYQVVYRIGVFISRSPIKLLIIKNLWSLPLILCALVALLTSQVFVRFIPYLWIVMILVFTEGFINGMSYVSTFMHATNKLDSVVKEFTLGVITLSGPVGIVLAGITATPFHNYICTLDIQI